MSFHGSDLAELARWLRMEAKRQIEGCRRLAHDGFTQVYMPDGKGHYGAMWSRDFCYMVEGFPEAISDLDLENSVRYLMNGIREDGVAPDRVQVDGRPLYSAGPPDAPLGEPPTDNSQFLTKLAFLCVKRTGNTRLFDEWSPALEGTLKAVPRSSDGLVFIDPKGPRRSPYGFTDTVGKTGAELFASLLFWEASRCMAELYERTGRDSDAVRWRTEAENVKRGLSVLWDSDEGVFLAATNDCRQPDVWGSAYAVFIGVVDKEQGLRVSQWLDRHYDEIVWQGMIRHIREPEGWRKMLLSTPAGIYQNGAYWPVPTAWFAHALRLTDQAKAQQTLIDLLRHMREHGINEWETPQGQVGVRDYVASATLPLIGVRGDL